METTSNPKKDNDSNFLTLEIIIIICVVIVVVFTVSIVIFIIYKRKQSVNITNNKSKNNTTNSSTNKHINNNKTTNNESNKSYEEVEVTTSPTKSSIASKSREEDMAVNIISSDTENTPSKPIKTQNSNNSNNESKEPKMNKLKSQSEQDINRDNISSQSSVYNTKNKSDDKNEPNINSVEHTETIKSGSHSASGSINDINMMNEVILNSPVDDETQVKKFNEDINNTSNNNNKNRNSNNKTSHKSHLRNNSEIFSDEELSDDSFQLFFRTDHFASEFEHWLNSVCGLDKYMDLFVLSQCNDIRIVPTLQKNNLLNDIGVKDENDINILLSKVEEFRKSMNQFDNWIKNNNFDIKKYKNDINLNGILTLDSLKRFLKQHKQDNIQLYNHVKDKMPDV